MYAVYSQAFLAGQPSGNATAIEADDAAGMILAALKNRCVKT